MSRAKLKLYKGTKSALPPTVDVGEVLYTVDTNELFVGDKDGKPVKPSNNTHYKGVTVTKYRDETSLTNYYLTHIPYIDKDNNKSIIKRGFANDIINGGTVESVRSFANRHSATVAINASVFNVTTNKLLGTQVNDNQTFNEGTEVSRYVLGIKPDNEFSVYPPGTPSSTIMGDKCIHALTSFIPLIQNSIPTSQTILDAYPGGIQPHPRQVLAQYPNKDIVILTCEGRTTENVGMTSADLIRILLTRGVKFAFMLDGGGSTQTVVRGSLINNAIDGDGYVERGVPDFLYFAKEDKVENDVTNINIDLGELAKKVADILLDVKKKENINTGFMRLNGIDGFISQGIESWEGDIKNTKLLMNRSELSYYDYVGDKYLFRAYADGTLQTSQGYLGELYQDVKLTTNLNTITKSGMYWATVSTLNIPDNTTSWSIVHIRYNSQSCMQIAYSYTSPFAQKVRRMSSGVWSAWA